jgi:hypothetical protein
MKKIIFIFFITIILSYNIISNEPIKLNKNWETESILKKPESVIYDSNSGFLYISNINGNILKKDNNGFISKFSIDGKLIDLKFIENLNAPKGLGIYNNKLFVADINELVIIDLLERKIIRKIQIDKAKFLNDIVIDNNGIVFISDMNDNKIYQFSNNKISIFLESSELYYPNGLFIYKNQLLVGNRKDLLSINFETKKIKKFIGNTGMIDGIALNGKGNFIISNFLGKVQIINNNQIIKLLDLTKDKKNAADLYYIIDKNILLIPTFNGNSVISYSFDF